MTRRTLLQIVSSAPAISGLSEFLSAWRAAGANAHAHRQGEHTDAPPEPDWLREYQPRFFDHDDFAALEAFTAILIPTDETPGARDARCAQFIDFLLTASGEYAPEMQDEWRSALQKLKAAGFHAANSEQKAALVEAASAPERDRTQHHPLFASYRLIKHETVFAFYTSRAGSIEALDYRGNSYNVSFPACTHPEHHVV